MAEDKTWYESCGRFFLTFAAIESDLPSIVSRIAGTPPSVAEVLLKGINVDKCIKHINALLNHVRWEKGEVEHFRARIVQLELIRGIRNGLAHRVAIKIDHRVREVETRKSQGNVAERITADDLLNMTEDLECIGIFFSLRFSDEPRSEGGEKAYQFLLKRPWSYVPET